MFKTILLAGFAGLTLTSCGDDSGSGSESEPSRLALDKEFVASSFNRGTYSSGSYVILSIEFDAVNGTEEDDLVWEVNGLAEGTSEYKIEANFIIDSRNYELVLEKTSFPDDGHSAEFITAVPEFFDASFFEFDADGTMINDYSSYITVTISLDPDSIFILFSDESPFFEGFLNGISFEGTLATSGSYVKDSQIEISDSVVDSILPLQD